MLEDMLADWEQHGAAAIAKIVKERDDLLTATRYAMMMKRYAETEPGPKLSIIVGGRSRGGWMGQ